MAGAGRTPQEDGREEPRAPSSLGRAAMFGVFWLTLGRVAKSLVNVVVTAILARLLDPADFGIVAIAYVVSTLGSLLADGTFGMVLVQKQDVGPGEIGAALLLSISLGAIFGLAIIVGAPAIESFFSFPDLSDALRLLALVLPVTTVGAVWTALLQRASQFRALMINSAVAQVVGGVSAIAMAVAGFGLWSLVWAQVIGTTAETALAYVASRRLYRFGFERAALVGMLRSGGMFTVTKTFNWAAASVDRIVIGRIMGAAPLGFYSRAASMMGTANQLVGAAAMRVLFSTFSRIQSNRERLLKAFDRALSTSVVVSSLGSAFVVLFAHLVVRIVLGPKWTTATPLIQALFAAFVARNGYIVADAVPLALGLSGASALRQGAQLVLVVGGALAGARFGLVGAAIGVAAAYWIFYLLCLGLVVRLLDVTVGRLLRIHLNGVLVSAPPVAAALAAAALAGPADTLSAHFIPVFAFAVTAAAVLGLAPEPLISDDLGRLRRRTFSLVTAREGAGR